MYDTMLVKNVISCYDGDTIRVDIWGLPDIIGKNISIRISGIDTPELRDKRPEIKALAIEARDLVREYLSNASKIELRNPSRGKYFRIVAALFLDGINISEILLAENLAKEYDGGKKKEWTINENI